jgi:hypothetical protein
MVNVTTDVTLRRCGNGCRRFRETCAAIFVDCLIHADEGTTFLRNLGNHSPNDRASHHRRSESSATPLKKKISNPLKFHWTGTFTTYSNARRQGVCAIRGSKHPDRTINEFDLWRTATNQRMLLICRLKEQMMYVTAILLKINCDAPEPPFWRENLWQTPVCMLMWIPFMSIRKHTMHVSTYFRN